MTLTGTRGPGRRRRVATAAACLAGLGLSLLVAPRVGAADPSASALLGVQATGSGAAVAVPPVTGFAIGTFNVLGSQHTAGDPAYSSGRKRARTTARLVEQKAIDLIGFQEVQDDQLRVLRRRLPGYQVWPGRRLGRGAVRLQLAWKRSSFDLVSSGWVDTPFDRQVRPMPWVQLEHRGSRRKIFVIDTHNSPRGLETERDTATDQQLALINQLRASRKAVFFLGDMNEKREIFCRVVGKTTLVAANGGSARSKRDCTLPDGPLRIDWIFGAGPMSFSDYRSFDGDQVHAASDHHLIRAVVTLRPRRE